MQDKQLVSEVLLQKTNKVLFIAHLALGDFTYMQPYFDALMSHYPHLKIDLWIDESRRKRHVSSKDLSMYALYDWVESCELFGKVYKQTFTPTGFSSAVEQVHKEKYPLIISLGVLRRYKYASLSRMLGQDAFIAGIGCTYSPWNLVKKYHLSKLNAKIIEHRLENTHISQTYGDWFKQLFGFSVDVKPNLKVPSVWLNNVKNDLLRNGFEEGDAIFFVNGFAKEKKRSWSIKKIFEVVLQLQRAYKNKSLFIVVNAVPSQKIFVEEYFKKTALNKVVIFSADQSFFQLLAMVKYSNVVVSVETSIMHLASSLNIPVIAVMRTKNPEWVPLNKYNSRVLFASRRNDWVEDVPTNLVIKTLKESRFIV